MASLNAKSLDSGPFTQETLFVFEILVLKCVTIVCSFFSTGQNFIYGKNIKMIYFMESAFVWMPKPIEIIL